MQDCERSLRFYTERLGFTKDWDAVEDGEIVACQVSLFGFELILNETGQRTRPRIGHGRVFIGLEDHQGEPVREHLMARGIRAERVSWGRPTLAIRDPDGNDLFFWLPHDDFTGLDAPESKEGAD